MHTDNQSHKTLDLHTESFKPNETTQLFSMKLPSCSSWFDRIWLSSRVKTTYALIPLFASIERCNSLATSLCVLHYSAQMILYHSYTPNTMKHGKTIHMVKHHTTIYYNHIIYNQTSWWFQPIWTILVRLDHFPRDEHKKYLSCHHPAYILHNHLSTTNPIPPNPNLHLLTKEQVVASRL